MLLGRGNVALSSLICLAQKQILHTLSSAPPDAHSTSSSLVVTAWHRPQIGEPPKDATRSGMGEAQGEADM